MYTICYTCVNIQCKYIILYIHVYYISCKFNIHKCLAIIYINIIV